MRPLTNTVKTALIFYLGFVGLLTAVTFMPPAFRTTGARVDRNNSSLPKTGTSDLGLKQQEFKKSWRQMLVNSGYIPQGIYKLQAEKLNERQDGPEKVEWMSSESTIVLPAAASKNRLVGLSSQWAALTRSAGFDVTSTRWGYSGGYLWVKLNSSVRLQLAGHYYSLPLEQLTIVQRVSKLDGKLPGLIPEFPPELNTKDLLKPVPGPVAKVSPPETPEFKNPSQAKTQEFKNPPHLKRRAKVAIIIDDVGYVTGPADEMLKIPAHLTWSVLSEAPYTRKYTEAAKERGFEVLLHLPLEPVDGNTKPGPGVIRRDWTEEEIADQLNKDLAEIPEAVGINNHMGSAGTSDNRLMEILMKDIKQHQLFFVDSMTIASSVAEKYARLNNLPFAKRKVFIDNGSSISGKKEALRRLIKIALKDGEAIGIAHVREGTAEAINEMLPEFAKAGIEIVPVSELVR